MGTSCARAGGPESWLFSFARFCEGLRLSAQMETAPKSRALALAKAELDQAARRLSPAIALNMLRPTGGLPEYRRCRAYSPGSCRAWSLHCQRLIRCSRSLRAWHLPCCRPGNDLNDCSGHGSARRSGTCRCAPRGDYPRFGSCLSRDTCRRTGHAGRLADWPERRSVAERCRDSNVLFQAG